MKISFKVRSVSRTKALVQTRFISEMSMILYKQIEKAPKISYTFIPDIIEGLITFSLKAVPGHKLFIDLSKPLRRFCIAGCTLFVTPGK